MAYKFFVIKYMFLFLGMYLFSMSFCAQTSFKLSKEGMHYYIYATVNGHENTRLFVESGVPGMLIGESDFNRLLKGCQFERIDSAPAEIKHQFGTRKVRQLLKGKIRIGDLSYKGSIWVVDKYDNGKGAEIAIPIHRLKNDSDSAACVIQLDFKKNNLALVKESSIDKSEMKSYKIVSFYPKPIFESELYLSDKSGHYGSLSGRFMFDLGNPMPLYLFYKNPEVTKFLSERKFKIVYANDEKEKRITSGIYSIDANNLKIGDRKLTNIPIAITTAFNITEYVGFVGPSLFRGRVLIDEKNGLIYYE